MHFTVDGCILTHWGRLTHLCVSKLTIISSDNGLAPGRRKTIIWTNDGVLLIGPWTNFSEILIEIQVFSFKKMHLKMSSAKWRPFCLGLNVLTCKDWTLLLCAGTFTCSDDNMMVPCGILSDEFGTTRKIFGCLFISLGNFRCQAILNVLNSRKFNEAVTIIFDKSSN